MSKERIFVALSGGVDSAVAAFLLKKRSVDLIAVHALFYREPELKEKQRQDLKSAKGVADRLKIPFYKIDLTDQFKEIVIGSYLKGYQQGLTPNPCVICNRELKFGLLKDRIFSLGADKLATGHYLRLKNNQIYRAEDADKDQSYFLWALRKNQLQDLIFPLGSCLKKDVRKIARENNIQAYRRDESRGICFYPKSGHNQFIQKYAGRLNRPGEVLNRRSVVIGRHQGAAFYTVGQRIGFEIDTAKAGFKGISPPPLYVLRVIPEKNQLIVGADDDLYQDRFKVSQLNWISKKPAKKEQISVQVRYLHSPVEAKIKIEANNNRGLIETKEEIRAIVPGQSAVFYRDNLLLGGGIIER